MDKIVTRIAETTGVGLKFFRPVVPSNLQLLPVFTNRETKGGTHFIKMTLAAQARLRKIVPGSSTGKRSA